jgi:hypothetical protein
MTGKGFNDSSGGLRYDSKHGQDFEKINPLPSVTNSQDGIAAEHRWTEEHFPGSQWLRQQTRRNTQGQVVDEITLRTASGIEVPVYFDISSWYPRDVS